MGIQKLLFTGRSGFLGENIYHLLSCNYEMESVGLSDIDTYNLDISKEIPALREKYDVVLHAAGKAHFVPRTESEKQLIFDVNVKGTVNLCTAFERYGIPKSIIFISTVAVYGLDFGNGITEEFPLNGKTPYALSKIQAESFLQIWCANHDVILGIVRPSLIAGKNPPGNLGTMIRGIKSNRYFRIGDGQTRKSVLMAGDIARFITKLTEIGGIYNVCDDHHPSFEELETLISDQLGKGKPWSIPYWVAKGLALIGDLVGDRFPINSLQLDKIVKPLTFSNEKAKKNLNWQPLDVLSNFILQ